MNEDWHTVALEIDDCKLVALISIEGRGCNALRLVVEEMLPLIGPENPERDFVTELAAEIRATMISQPVPRSFEIVFAHYVSYTMLDECYGKFPEPPEIFIGKNFRIFSWSYLLELTRKITRAGDDWPGPGPLRHYVMACSDDVVDVMTCVEPVISRLR